MVDDSMYEKYLIRRGDEIAEQFPDLKTNLKKYREDWHDIINYHPQCNRAELTTIFLLDKKGEYYFGLGRNLKTTTSILEKMADETEDLMTLYSISGNPKCSPRCLSVCYEKGRELGYREAILSGIGVDGSSCIKEKCAAHNKCPRHILDELADYPDNKIRVLVAGNKNTSVKTANKLAQSRSKLIQNALKKHWDII
jgi:hypothetical protein